MKPRHINDSSGQLFNEIISRFRLKNDAALCAILDVGAPVISKIRHGNNQVSADIILRVHEKLRIPVAEIRSLLNMYPDVEVGDDE
jgi:plasmid maintenance system antidote protein VapI